VRQGKFLSTPKIFIGRISFAVFICISRIQLYEVDINGLNFMCWILLDWTLCVGFYWIELHLLEIIGLIRIIDLPYTVSLFFLLLYPATNLFDSLLSSVEIWKVIHVILNCVAQKSKSKLVRASFRKLLRPSPSSDPKLDHYDTLFHLFGKNWSCYLYLLRKSGTESETSRNLNVALRFQIK
jgi:hypothetical protein